MTKMPYINLFLFYTRCFSNKTGIVIGTPIRSTHRIKTVSTAIYITHTPNIFCIFITLSFIFAGSTLGVFSVNFCPWSFLFSFSRSRAIIRVAWASCYYCYLFLMLTSSPSEKAFILVRVPIWSTDRNVIRMALKLICTFQTISIFFTDSSIFTWWFITNSYIRFPHI